MLCFVNWGGGTCKEAGARAFPYSVMIFQYLKDVIVSSRSNQKFIFSILFILAY